MTIQFDATYRDGVIHPKQPLALADGAEVHVVVAPVERPKKRTPEELAAMRPKAPRFTGKELHERIEKYSVKVGGLPLDFSREDIYSDHD